MEKKLLAYKIRCIIGIRSVSKTSINIDRIIQLLGITGIVGSLLFVGLEMRQTQKIAIAGQQQDRSAMGITLIKSFNERGIDFTSVLGQNKYDLNLSPIEIAHRNGVQIAWFLAENDYYQYKLGLMDQKTWNAKINAMKFYYNNCDLRGLYSSREQFFSAGFKEIIETFPDRCD